MFRVARGGWRRSVAASLAFVLAATLLQVVALAEPASAAVTHVQTAAGNANTAATTLAQAFTTPNKAGNTIVAAVAWNGNASVTCTDAKGNIYATAITRYDATGAQSTAVCYAMNVAGGANTVTATFSASVTGRRLIVHEYGGLATSGIVDVTAGNAANGTTAANNITSTAASTVTNGDLVFGAVVDVTGTTTISAGTNFTQRNSTATDFATQDFTQATAGSIVSTQTFATAHRYIALMVAFKPYSAPASGPAHVQTAASTNNAAATTIAQAFSANITGGSSIVAAVSWDLNATLTCSDTRGNVYATAATRYDTTNTQSVGVCYAVNAAPGQTTVTATLSASSTNRRIIVHEYRGLATSGVVDVTATNAANGTTAANNVTSTVATTTTANDLVFGAVMDTAGTAAISAGTGFTQRNSLNGKDFATQDMVKAVAGSVASTQTFGTAHRYAAVMVAFKPFAAAPLAPTHVQTAASTNNAGATTITQALTANVVAGNAIVAAVSWDGTATLSCSDTQGNSYTTVITRRETTDNQSVGICYSANASPGKTTVTATFSASSTFRRIIAHQYSGIAAAGALDGDAGETGLATTATDNVTTGTATPGSSGDLIFGAVVNTTGTSAINAGTGFTQRNSLNSKDFATQDLVQGNAGSVASTHTFGTAHRYAAVMIALKPAVAPPFATFTATTQNGANALAVDTAAAGSIAGSGSITNYSWNWGDTQTSVGVNGSHTYSAPGTYTITLTVTNSAGLQSSTTRQVIRSCC